MHFRFKFWNFLTWISLTNFHAYNQTHGWHTGDQLLISLAHTLEFQAKESVRVYRFYGDNFFILTQEDSEIDKLHVYVETLLKEQKIKYNFESASLKGVKIHKLESLDDVLKKLF